MVEIVSLLVCLYPSLSRTTVGQLSRIVVGLLAMSGRVTMLGISRWTGRGGSYRTVQRFFGTVIPWGMVFWLFFRRHLFDREDVYLLAGDECVVTKSGKCTHGLDRFFSSLYGKSVPGLAFFALSLISTKQRYSYPMQVEQVVKTEAEKAAAVARKKAAKRKPKRQRKRGRPKGSKNKDKTQVTLTPELTRIQHMVQTLLAQVGHFLSLTYLVLDGHFGNNNALQMTLQSGLQLISKLRFDAALYFPYEGEYAGRGPRRKYGDRLQPEAIPVRYLKQVTIDKRIETRVYQAQMLHKEFAQPLNVVVILKTHLATGRTAHVLLFSSDLTLAYDKLIDSYSLRFQLEFNFRDAKQFWGLEDFMNVKPTAVTNAANLALFMVNISHKLLQSFRKACPDFSVIDLKAYCRGLRYIDEVTQCLPQIPETIVLDNIKQHVASLGAIHHIQTQPSPS
jgi:putative transposase